MATTWIKPIRVSKGKTPAQTIQDSLDYIVNPDKTRNGNLVTSYACDPRTAATELLMSKREYAVNTGREYRKRDVLLYHMRQSFKPGEISPEEANRISYEWAMRFTKGCHSFVVSTHIDKRHIHCHIMFNSTDIEAQRKFKNFWGTTKVIRRLSDLICIENGLHVIENPKPSKGKYFEWMEHKKEPSLREKLEQMIDDVLAQKPVDFDEFIKLLKKAGCEIKQGKHISLKAEGQKRFIRMRSLSDNYTEDAIREIISGKREHTPKNDTADYGSQIQDDTVNHSSKTKTDTINHAAQSSSLSPRPERKFSLLIDVQNSIKAQSSPGYERWAKLFSLKEAAKTLLFLQDNGLDDLGNLAEAAQKSKDNFNDIQTRIHAADSRMKEVTVLQKHIGAYVKTKDVYAEYKRRKFSKKFLSENEKAITDHKAAKAHFDELKLEKLPTINMLKQEYAALSAEKKKLYTEHHKAKTYMQDILLAKQNTEMLLNYHDAEQTRAADRDVR